MDGSARNRLGLTNASTGGAIGLGLVIGLGVLFYVREARTAKNLPVDLADASVSAPVTTGPRDGGFRYYGTFDAGYPALSGTAHAGRGSVRIVAPPGARIFADGRELPAGTTTVTRPEKGIVSILVKADGMRDTALAVEPSSPDELRVTMAPAPASTGGSGPGPATTPAGPRFKPLPRPPASDNGLPPNPYQ